MCGAYCSRRWRMCAAVTRRSHCSRAAPTPRVARRLEQRRSPSAPPPPSRSARCAHAVLAELSNSARRHAGTPLRARGAHVGHARAPHRVARARVGQRQPLHPPHPQRAVEAVAVAAHAVHPLVQPAQIGELRHVQVGARAAAVVRRQLLQRVGVGNVDRVVRTRPSPKSRARRACRRRARWTTLIAELAGRKLRVRHRERGADVRLVGDQTGHRLQQFGADAGVRLTHPRCELHTRLFVAEPTMPPSLAEQMALPAAAGGLAVCFSHPLEPTKVRLQLDNELASRGTPRQYAGWMTAPRRTGGARACAGCSAACRSASRARSASTPCASGCTSQSSARWSGERAPSPRERMAAGFTQRALGGCCVNPIEVLKVRMQAQDGLAGHQHAIANPIAGVRWRLSATRASPAAVRGIGTSTLRGILGPGSQLIAYNEPKAAAVARGADAVGSRDARLRCALATPSCVGRLRQSGGRRAEGTTRRRPAVRSGVGHTVAARHRGAARLLQGQRHALLRF